MPNQIFSQALYPGSGGNIRTDYPEGATPVFADSGVKAAAVATATIPAVASKTNYLAGFTVTGSGATAGLPVTVAVAGLGATLSYTYSAAAGALVANTPLNITFPRPIPATTASLAVTVTCPSLGTGSTNNTVNAYGYYI